MRPTEIKLSARTLRGSPHRGTYTAEQRRSQEFDLGGYKWICPGSRRQNNHIKKLR